MDKEKLKQDLIESIINKIYEMNEKNNHKPSDLLIYACKSGLKRMTINELNCFVSALVGI